MGHLLAPTRLPRGEAVRRPLPGLAAGLRAGATAAVVGLLVLAVPVILLWIASPRVDETFDGTLHTAACLWLVAHGAELTRIAATDGRPTPVGLTPLLLMALPCRLLYRAGLRTALPARPGGADGGGDGPSETGGSGEPGRRGAAPHGPGPYDWLFGAAGLVGGYLAVAVPFTLAAGGGTFHVGPVGGLLHVAGLAVPVTACGVWRGCGGLDGLLRAADAAEPWHAWLWERWLHALVPVAERQSGERTVRLAPADAYRSASRTRRKAGYGTPPHRSGPRDRPYGAAYPTGRTGEHAVASVSAAVSGAAGASGTSAEAAAATAGWRLAGLLRFGAAVRATAWLRANCPRGGAAAVRGALLTTCALGGGGAVLLAFALAAHGGRAVSAVSEVAGDLAGVVSLLAVAVLLIPNGAVWAVAYAVGAGFTAGVGHPVGPDGAHPGRLPAFPLLAAVPDAAATTTVAWAVAAVPVAGGAVAAWYVGRRAVRDAAGRAAPAAAPDAEAGPAPLLPSPAGDGGPARRGDADEGVGVGAEAVPGRRRRRLRGRRPEHDARPAPDGGSRRGTVDRPRRRSGRPEEPRGGRLRGLLGRRRNDPARLPDPDPDPAAAGRSRRPAGSGPAAPADPGFASPFPAMPPIVVHDREGGDAPDPAPPHRPGPLGRVRSGLRSRPRRPRRTRTEPARGTSRTRDGAAAPPSPVGPHPAGTRPAAALSRPRRRARTEPGSVVARVRRRVRREADWPAPPPARDRWSATGTAVVAALTSAGAGAVQAGLALLASGPLGTRTLAVFGPSPLHTGLATAGWTVLVALPGALLVRLLPTTRH